MPFDSECPNPTPDVDAETAALTRDRTPVARPTA